MMINSLKLLTKMPRYYLLQQVASSQLRSVQKKAACQAKKVVMQNIKGGAPKDFLICRECDWVTVNLSASKKSQSCTHCGATLTPTLKPPTFSLVYSLCALSLLLISLYAPFLEINIMGIINKISLFDVLLMLYQTNEFFLAIVLFCFVFCFPTILLIIQIFLLLPFFMTKTVKKFLLIIYFQLKLWTLPEIFMAGVCVSFIKLTSYGEISFFAGFWTFCFFVFVYIKATLFFPYGAVWDQVEKECFITQKVQVNQSAMSQNIRLCHCCYAVLPSDQTLCFRCGVKGATRRPFALQVTVGFLISAAVLYLPANILPVMQTVFLGASEGSTILDGVIYMWGEGDYPVALIILCASVLIPLFKITGLFLLCSFCHLKAEKTVQTCRKWTKLYNVIEMIGKWSMIDVFVVIILMSLIQNGQMVAVSPDHGVYFFASVVIITMIASKQFDPRLIWDRPLIESSQNKLKFK